MRKRSGLLLLLVTIAAAGTAGALAAEHGMGGRPAGTPPELVNSYDSLADAILAAKKTEYNIVHSILAVTYGHADATVREIKGKLAAGKDVKMDMEKLADLVSQLGNEGDAAVAAIRKKLLEGGHHHHSNAEDQGIYDEGFVIVTRAAKKVFLDAAGEIGKMAGSASEAGVDAQWQKVSAQYMGLFKGM